MFDALSDKLQSVFDNFKSRGKLTEENISEGLKEVRKALLEADVNYKVVKDFIKNVKEDAVGESVVKSIKPGQQVVKIVHDRLIELMGEDFCELKLNYPLNIIMLVGLQGSGKTTTCCKLAKYIEKKHKKKTVMVSCDTQRPAAMEQLAAIGKQNAVSVYKSEEKTDAVKICQDAVLYAKQNAFDTLIVDTAGRLHIDAELMDELKAIDGLINPQFIYFVIDAMIGQDAVNVAKSFNETLNMAGVILTKLDGDTRGGAAISVRQVTGKPVVFTGVGEHVKDFEPFHPERMVSRILGMGDIVSLVERAGDIADEAEMKRLEKKMRKNTFDLEDFLKQLRQIKKMGPLEDLMKMVPGMNKVKLDLKGNELGQTEAIISSMTPKERQKPEIIEGSRKKRIAAGSGTNVHAVNMLLKNFTMMRKMMGKMNNTKNIQKLMNKMGG